MQPCARQDSAVQQQLMNCNTSATNSPTPVTPRRPPLAILKRGTSVVPSPEIHSASSSRESAFSFQHNLRTSLLFGKNNVIAFNGDRETPGYLSLHQDLNRLLLLKWIPNSLLLSECLEFLGFSSPFPSNRPNSTPSKSPLCIANSFVVSIRFEVITHIHLHKKDDSRSLLIVLIDADGVQQFSFRFTLLQHCLLFLKTLENGLAPLFRIDPPLSSITFGDNFTFSKPVANVKKSSFLSKFGSSDSPTEKQKNGFDGATGTDLVFRVVSFASPNVMQKGQTSVSPVFSRSSTQDSKGDTEQRLSLRESLSNATRAMQNQIVSRAFYGWLSYSRHLRTIRNNLATIVTVDGCLLESDGSDLPVNEVFWRLCRSEKTIPLYKQFLNRVYFCGVEPQLRAQTWPYLLRLLEWHEDIERSARMADIKRAYERDLAEWTELEKELAISEEQNNNNNGNGLHQDFDEYPGLRSCNSVCSDVFEEPAEEKRRDGSSLDNSSTSADNTLAKEFGVNLLRIQKDVDRCDRTTKFYAQMENLELLRKVICTYIYRRLKLDLEDGYVQGMCDLIAPLLVIFGDEMITLACFERLMQRLQRNFPTSTHNYGMEENLNNFRSLVEVMDPELYAQLMQNIDYSFVVFYRWLLLDFKRELVYKEVFQLWEVIWASSEMACSRHFELFFGLALLSQYREVLIENEMDFTDVIKFFNEMAEKHNVDELLDIARKKLRAFQEIVQDLDNPICQ